MVYQHKKIKKGGKCDIHRTNTSIVWADCGCNSHTQQQLHANRDVAALLIDSFIFSPVLAIHQWFNCQQRNNNTCIIAQYNCKLQTYSRVT